VANLVYPQGYEGFLRGEISWNVATIKASAIRGYTYSASHKFVSDATGAGATLVSTITLGTKTTVDGVGGAADNLWPTVTAGAPVDMILIYQASAVGGGADVAASAQRLIVRIDTATNLPFTPIGVDVPVLWPGGADKIFRV